MGGIFLMKQIEKFQIFNEYFEITNVIDPYREVNFMQFQFSHKLITNHVNGWKENP